MTVKLVSYFGPSNNNKLLLIIIIMTMVMWVVTAYRRSHNFKSFGLVWELAATWRPVCIHEMNHCRLSVIQHFFSFHVLLFSILWSFTCEYYTYQPSQMDRAMRCHTRIVVATVYSAKQATVIGHSERSLLSNQLTTRGDDRRALAYRVWDKVPEEYPYF